MNRFLLIVVIVLTIDYSSGDSESTSGVPWPYPQFFVLGKETDYRNSVP
jgi:hypothetical protein